MSTASNANVLAGSQIAAAVAAHVAANPNTTLTLGSIADVLKVILNSAGSLVANPEVGMGIAIASLALEAWHAATDSGAGLESYEQLDADDAGADAADKAARTAAGADSAPAATPAATAQATPAPVLDVAPVVAKPLATMPPQPKSAF